MTLRQLRKVNKKTPAEIASVLNVSIRTVFAYEQGTRVINIEQVLILSKEYGESAEEIIKAQLNSCRKDR